MPLTQRDPQDADRQEAAHKKQGGGVIVVRKKAEINLARKRVVPACLLRIDRQATVGRRCEHRCQSQDEQPPGTDGMREQKEANAEG